MKEKQNKRWRLKLLSVLSAFLVWLGVVNVADPVVTQTIELPVEIINEEVLTANDMTYEIVGKKTSTVTYEVKTTNAHRIRPADFRAYADMTDLWSVTGAIPIKIEVLAHSQYLESNPVSRTGTIKIETEPLQSKEFILGVTVSGTAAEGSVQGDITLSPSSITVEGPESLIGQISSVGVELNIDGASSDMEGKAIPQFYDANGNKIELNDRIESDCDSVGYYMTVLRVKNLALDFQVIGQAASGYRFTGVECDVMSVPVMGLRSALASLQTVTIPGEELNITGAKDNVVRSVNLEDYMPTGVSIAGMESPVIEVTMLVEPLEEQIFTVELTDESFLGKKPGYIYTPQPKDLIIRVRALPEELDSLTIEARDVQIDVSNLSEGVHRLEPQLELDRAYEIQNISACNINVTSEEDGPAGGSGESSSDPTEAGESGAEDVEAANSGAASGAGSKDGSSSESSGH